MAAWLEAHHLSHPLLALIPVAFAGLLGRPGMGAVFSIGFYAGREVAHVGTFWSNNPWWWGFDPRHWTWDNHLDFWPVIAAALAAAWAWRRYGPRLR